MVLADGDPSRLLHVHLQTTVVGAKRGFIFSGGVVYGVLVRMEAVVVTNTLQDIFIGIAGLIGAGKTTLLKRILTEEHRLRILVIENELGEEGIDHELVMRGGDDDDIILLRNGCVCCAIRDDLR